MQGFRHFIRRVTAESFCGGPQGTIDQSAFPFCLNTTEAKNGIRGAKRRCDLNTKQFSVTICGLKYIDCPPCPTRLSLFSCLPFLSVPLSCFFSLDPSCISWRRLYSFLEFLLYVFDWTAAAQFHRRPSGRVICIMQ